MDAYRVLTNPDLTAYKPFHDKQWMEEVMKKFDATKLSAPLFILNTVWFTYSRMFSLPSTFMQITKGIVDGQGESQGEGVRMTIQALKNKFCARNAFGLTVTKRQEIGSDLQRCESRIKQFLEKKADKLNEVSVFAEAVHVDKQGFGSGLAALIQQSFCGVYFAYDDFVKRCFWVLGGDMSLYTSSGTFGKKFKEKLDDDLIYQECWDCPEVKLARNARSLVAHSAGIYDRKPAEYDDYYILDHQVKRLLIHCDGVTRLYTNLKQRADKLSQHVYELKK